MSDLRHLINLNKISNTGKKLVVGDEYLIANRKCTGIYIGKSGRYVYFVLTCGTDSDYLVSPFYSSWRSIDINGVSVQRWFASVYKRISKVITNLQQLKIMGYDIRDTNNKIIPINSGVLTSDSVAKPILCNIVNKTLLSIKKDSPIGSSDYKIAKHLLSKLPTELCEINDTGIITSVGDTKEVQVFTLNKEKVLKALKKYDKLSQKEKQELAFDVSSLLINNFEQTKVGRVVKRFVGSLFPDDKIESFVSIFNSRMLNMSSYKLEVVQGEDIVKWYSVNSYTQDHHGTLQNSCMRQPQYLPQQKFYAQHPKCKMVILTMGGFLHGRALLWELTDGTKYLDRIYYTYETEKKIIQKWAVDNEITNSYDLTLDSRDETLLVETNLKSFKDLDKLQVPYTDTFRNITCNLKYMMSPRNNQNFATVKMTPEDLIYYKYGQFTFCRTSNPNINIDIRNWKELKSSNYKNLYLKEGEVMIKDSRDNFAVAKESDCVFDEKSLMMRLINEPKPEKSLVSTDGLTYTVSTGTAFTVSAGTYIETIAIGGGGGGERITEDDIIAF